MRIDTYAINFVDWFSATLKCSAPESPLESVSQLNLLERWARSPVELYCRFRLFVLAAPREDRSTD